jgi:hypothetical protein
VSNEEMARSVRLVE